MSRTCHHRAQVFTDQTPPRRLREYKGVVYENEHWLCRQFGMTYSTVSALIAAHDHHFTDADHAAIYALKDDPWEPVETLEAVLEDWANATRDGVHSVELSDLEHRLRAWLATQPQTITPEQAVAVLVEGGAKLEQVRIGATVGSTRMGAGTRVLILPTATPEVTP